MPGSLSQQVHQSNSKTTWRVLYITTHLIRLEVGAESRVRTQTALDSDGRVSDSGTHGGAAVGHDLRAQHERSAEAASAGDAVAGAAAVEVDLVVAISRRDRGSRRQLFRVASAQLQHNGPLLLREPEEPGRRAKGFVNPIRYVTLNVLCA